MGPQSSAARSSLTLLVGFRLGSLRTPPEPADLLGEISGNSLRQGHRHPNLFLFCENLAAITAKTHSDSDSQKQGLRKAFHCIASHTVSYTLSFYYFRTSDRLHDDPYYWSCLNLHVETLLYATFN